MSKKTSKRTGIVSKTRSNKTTRLAMLEKILCLATAAVELLTAIVLYLSA